MTRTLFAAVLFAVPMLAQEPIPARAFLLDDYKNVVAVDLAKLRATDVWGDLEASVLGTVLGQLEQELGGPLDALDRLMMVAEFADEEGDARDIREVRILEGNTGLPVPKSFQYGTNWKKDEIAGRAVWRRGGYREERMYQPKPEAQVWGTGLAIDPVLEGKPRQGLPSADVMSLLSGKGEVLAYFVVDVAHPVLKQRVLGVLFDGVEWPAGEAPTFLCVRLLATGDADDLQLTVEVVLRHAAEGEGIAVSDKAVDAFLERVRTDPALKLLRPAFQQFVKKRDRADLRLVADLGRSRQAVGHVATLALALLVPSTIEPVQAPPVPPAPAAPQEKKD